MADFEFNFTPQKLAAILNNNPASAEWHAALCRILPKYGITSVKRVAAFLSQCAHESADFKVLKENLNYRKEGLCKVFPKYFKTEAQAIAYANQPAKIASRVYADRMGNGSEASGDGWNYCGRGLIQITGKSNYTKFAESVGMSLSDAVTYMGTTAGALESACWYWSNNKINQLADTGNTAAVTKVINGGNNGLPEREKKYQLALTILAGK